MKSFDSCDGTDEGGLAGPVGAHNGDDLAFRHFKGDVVQGLGIPVIQIQVFYFKKQTQISVSSPR